MLTQKRTCRKKSVSYFNAKQGPTFSVTSTYFNPVQISLFRIHFLNEVYRVVLQLLYRSRVVYFNFTTYKSLARYAPTAERRSVLYSFTSLDITFLTNPFQVIIIYIQIKFDCSNITLSVNKVEIRPTNAVFIIVLNIVIALPLLQRKRMELSTEKNKPEREHAKTILYT